MKFCNQCDNMLYIKTNQEDENKLKYYCRNCEYEDKTLTGEGVCVLDTQIKKSQQKFDHITNPYTEMDPTLPPSYTFHGTRLMNNKISVSVIISVSISHLP